MAAKKRNDKEKNGFFDGNFFHEHKVFSIGGMLITAPAAIKYTRVNQAQMQSQRDLRHGEQMYALPAGGRITESGVILR